MHLFLVAMHLFLVAMHLFLIPPLIFRDSVSHSASTSARATSEQPRAKEDLLLEAQVRLSDSGHSGHSSHFSGLKFDHEAACWLGQCQEWNVSHRSRVGHHLGRLSGQTLSNKKLSACIAIPLPTSPVQCTEGLLDDPLVPNIMQTSRN